MSSASTAVIVGVHWDGCYRRHDTGQGHPESAHRYAVLSRALEEKLPPGTVRLAGRKANVAEVLLAHEAFYHDLVYRDVESFADVLRTGDTPLCEFSYEVALEAAGAVLAAVDAVMAGQIRRAFCAVRPPGHHATASRGMGFCIFNNVAIAARYLQSRHKLRRIAIVDFDVHHGNGTESIFWQDPDVFYVSLHEAGGYPFTGLANDRGEGEGLGTTLNLPLRSGSDGRAALTAWSEHAEPALEIFRPEFILISAGFDARRGDPLGGLEWDDATFEEITRRVVALANRHAEGRIVSSLEGGYDPQGLASAALAHIAALGDKD